MRGASRLLAAALLASPAALLVARRPASAGEARRAPEFPTQDRSRWVGEPVRLAELRGQVVLLDVWTFG